MTLFVLPAVLVMAIQIQSSEALDAKAPGRWFKKRPRRIFVSLACVFLLLQIIAIDWSKTWNEGVGSRELLILLALALVCVLFALLMTISVELLLEAGTLVLMQIRGWKKAPFDGWTVGQLEEYVGPTSDLGRWPHPEESNMTVQEATAYASLASETANVRWATGQLLVLVAGGVLGTSLASFASWQKGDLSGLYGAIASLLIGAFGVRFSLLHVQLWDKRSNAYQEYIESRTFEARSEQNPFARFVSRLTRE